MQYIKETEVSLYNSLNKDMDREVDNEINNLANMIGSGNDEMRIYDQIQNKSVQLDGPPIDRSDRSNDAVNTNTTTTPLNPWKDAMTLLVRMAWEGPRCDFCCIAYHDAVVDS